MVFAFVSVGCHEAMGCTYFVWLYINGCFSAVARLLEILRVEPTSHDASVRWHKVPVSEIKGSETETSLPLSVQSTPGITGMFNPDPMSGASPPVLQLPPFHCTLA